MSLVDWVLQCLATSNIRYQEKDFDTTRKKSFRTFALLINSKNDCNGMEGRPYIRFLSVKSRYRPPMLPRSAYRGIERKDPGPESLTSINHLTPAPSSLNSSKTDSTDSPKKRKEGGKWYCKPYCCPSLSLCSISRLVDLLSWLVPQLLGTLLPYRSSYLFSQDLRHSAIPFTSYLAAKRRPVTGVSVSGHASQVQPVLLTNELIEGC
ncbi:hypothetical protein STAS_24933 [Striga asiatica]|uniref:Uncharacterized protein n=1 Tax=Striga asiatica TaxID=4170 RepID=A0A5A7QRX6_STRAF|nr:hypothetical protein STAS_24933 [Striga asiatica]